MNRLTQVYFKENKNKFSSGPNSVNEILNKRVNDGGKLHITPSKVGSTYILRFAVCSRYITFVIRNNSKENYNNKGDKYCN